MFQGDTSHLPLKLNTAGVIPPIFASSLLLLPATLAGFSNTGDLPAGHDGCWPRWATASRLHAVLCAA
jgi:preprotein translocase subunit SecY